MLIGSSVATRDLRPVRDAEKLLSQWHDVDPRPTLILAGDQLILWSNGAARHFIQAFDGVGIVRGVLTVDDRRQHQALGEQLAAAALHPHCWMLESEGGERSVVLSIQLLADDAYGVRCLEQRPPVFADFRRVYGLTLAEDRVLPQLLSGRVAGDIARADGGSLETVRAHIKAIYAKMGVCSREGLFHAAGRFRLA